MNLKIYYKYIFFNITYYIYIIIMSSIREQNIKAALQTLYDNNVFRVDFSDGTYTLNNGNVHNIHDDPTLINTTPPQDKRPQKGGLAKNIFKKSLYSETSSFNQSDMSNYSATSTDVFRSDKYSETSVIGQVGGKATLLDTSTDIFKSDKYSETSIIGQIGGRAILSDTLDELSELKQRKSLNTISSTKLDMGIFTKKSQSGGAIDSIKRKMMEIGINSNSSTSSICE